MVDAELVWRLGLGLLFIGANAFFVAIEFALTRVRQYPESAFDTPGLRRAWEMTDDLEIYLTSCQVGITASSIALGIVAEPALRRLFEPWFANTSLAALGAGGVLAFIVLNVVHLTHGEQTPTYLGVERTRFVARWGARPLAWFTRAIYPAILVGDKVAKATLRLFGVRMTRAWLDTGTQAIESRADLRARLSNVLEEGGLPADRRDEVLQALDIGDEAVDEILTPADQMVILDSQATTAENLLVMAQRSFTRYPLMDPGGARLEGIIYVPAILSNLEALQAGETGLKEIAAPPMTLPAGTSISDAIDAFQDRGQEMALVVDEEGSYLGLLTATDALERVVGQLEDPLDRAAGG